MYLFLLLLQLPNPLTIIANLDYNPLQGYMLLPLYNNSIESYHRFCLSLLLLLIQSSKHCLLFQLAHHMTVLDHTKWALL